MVKRTTSKNNDMTLGRPAKPNFPIPNGYENEAAFLLEMRQEFHDDINFDRTNREAALEDLRFMVGDQWDDIVRQRREAARKPVLTVNRLPAFVAQIIGNRRMNETDIKVKPDMDGTAPIAKLREGLIRNIQKQSLSDNAYDTALEGSSMCGIGNFMVELDYADDDVFEQTIKINPIHDHLSVVWDRGLTDPTGADANHVFIVDTMKKRNFEQKWPWATATDITVDVTLRGDLRMNGWIAIDDVRVVDYWRIRTHKRTIALMADTSKVEDVTEVMNGDNQDEKNLVLMHAATYADGTPIMREVNRRFAQKYTCSGSDILEGPYELPIRRLPVFRVPGWEVNVGQWKHRWGLIRFAKDPQRLHNYWRSVLAEKLMQTPRAVWAAADTAVSGRENQWRYSHMSDDPLLIWNAESGQKPERIPPAIVEDALLAQAEITNQDIKDVTNIHEANLGMPSNEVSGVAINARQRVSDIGTFIYHDNLNKAIMQCGTVINDLIPVCYDTARTIKVLGDDGKEELAQINDPDAGHPDITTGRYSVTVSTGPAFATKRAEAAEAMMSLANAMPQVLGVAADLIVQAQDWPWADKIAGRIKKTLPPGLLDPKDMTPDMLQNAQAQAQQAQQNQKMMIQQAIQEFLKTQAETALAAARARSFNAQADSVPVKLQNESLSTASQAADRELRGSLEAIKTAHSG